MAMTEPVSHQTLDEQIGEKVNFLMWRHRLTQTALAPRLGITQSNLSKKVRGVVAFSPTDLVAVARALGVEVGELFKPLSAGYDESPRPVLDEGSAEGVRPKGFEPPTF